MTIREQQEKREHEVLSRYAAFSDQTGGAVRPQNGLPERQGQDTPLQGVQET